MINFHIYFGQVLRGAKCTISNLEILLNIVG